jgi:hypothetical protein
MSAMPEGTDFEYSHSRRVQGKVYGIGNVESIGITLSESMKALQMLKRTDALMMVLFMNYYYY